jgi:hypothetical protein
MYISCTSHNYFNNCCPHVQSTFGKCDVYADEELMEEKKTKEMCMLEKFEVLHNFEKGMRITVVRTDYSENNTMILFMKKNEDKVRGNIMACVPLSVQISCLSPCQPFLKK